MKGALFCVILSCCLLPGISFSQDKVDPLDKIISLPNKFLSDINKRTGSIESQLSSVGVSYLKKLSKQENKLKKRLSKLDSVSASKLFPNDIQNQYGIYIQNLKSDSV